MAGRPDSNASHPQKPFGVIGNRGGNGVAVISERCDDSFRYVVSHGKSAG